HVAAGRLDRAGSVLAAAARKGALPNIDPALIEEREAMHDRVVARWEQGHSRSVTHKGQTRPAGPPPGRFLQPFRTGVIIMAVTPHSVPWPCARSRRESARAP